MDLRVFPFAFPPIKGGAQGGDSPTPTPPEFVTYYDLDSVQFKISPFTSGGKWKEKDGGTYIHAVNIGIEGVIPLDVSNVASLEISAGLTSLTAGGDEYTEDDNFSDIVVNVTYTGTDVSLSDYDNYLRGKTTVAYWNSTMYDKTAGGQAFLKLTAYDSNGNILQTKTWTALIT